MSFVYTELKYQAILYLKIHFSLSHFFELSSNVKQHTLTHREDELDATTHCQWTAGQ